MRAGYFLNFCYLPITAVNSLLRYVLTTVLLLIAGIVWVYMEFFPEPLRFVALGMAIFGCAIINLIYFFPGRYVRLKFILPGLITAIGCMVFIQGSNVEEKFFTFFGVANLLIGILWSLCKTSKSKN